MSDTQTTVLPGLEQNQPGKKLGFAHRLYTGAFAWEFVGRKKLWYTISAIALTIALLGLVVRGLNLGIEFRGGAEFQAPIAVTSSTVPDVRAAVDRAGVAGIGDVQVVTKGTGEVSVQTKSLTTNEVIKVRTAIAKVAGLSNNDRVAYSLIGPSWGRDVSQQALIALIVFLVLVMLLIGVYFREFKMSIAAIVALLHDLILTVGLYALTGISVTPATLIGVLTILGYSLYDTVVVFDKVRENTRDLQRSNLTYSQAANRAVNQVLIRSINTTIIGVLPVAALLFAGAFILGSGPLEDLGLALFIGMIVGAYSSVFIATPLACQLKETEPEMIAHRERIAKRGSRIAPKVRARAATLAAPPSLAAIPTSTEGVGLLTPTQVAVRPAGQKRPPSKNQNRSTRKK